MYLWKEVVSLGGGSGEKCSELLHYIFFLCYIIFSYRMVWEINGLATTFVQRLLCG